jgi:hypothetical protein
LRFAHFETIFKLKASHRHTEERAGPAYGELLFKQCQATGIAHDDDLSSRTGAGQDDGIIRAF